MSCAVACCEVLPPSVFAERGPSRRAPFARVLRYALVVALAVIAAYGEGWVLREAPAPSPEFAGARCVAAAAFDAPPATSCTLVSLE